MAIASVLHANLNSGTGKITGAKKPALGANSELDPKIVLFPHTLEQQRNLALSLEALAKSKDGVQHVTTAGLLKSAEEAEKLEGASKNPIERIKTVLWGLPKVAMATPADSIATDNSGIAKAHQDPLHQPYKEVADSILSMVAIDEGSTTPHNHIDETALQRLRMGASYTELLNIKGKLSAVDGFMVAGPVDINPAILGHTIPNETPAIAAALEAKRIAHEASPLPA